MPGLVMEEADGNGASNNLQSPVVTNENDASTTKPHMASNPGSQLGECPEAMFAGASIDQLYDNVCDMESSADGSLSRQSFGSDGDESRIDSELTHLVGGEIRTAEGTVEREEEEDVGIVREENGSDAKKPETNDKAQSEGGKNNSGSSRQPNRQEKRTSPESADKSVTGKKVAGAARLKKQKNPINGETKFPNEDPSEAGLDNPNLGPYLLKHARDLIQGDNHRRALDYAVRASKSFEKCANGKPSLDLVMSLHVLGAIYCSTGQHALAVPVLERAIDIPVVAQGDDHALAKFAGHMQLGDTYAMLGKLERAIWSYSSGLEVQKQALGENDPRVGETCRYIAEVHLQALQFDEAERLCKKALDIHRENGEPASAEETADRRLMGLICEAKGDHDSALEHLVLASMAMSSSGRETEVASVDCSIGDIYLSMTRYDEAVFAYHKALTKLKTSKGDNHPSVASILVRLADLYNKTGKIKESKSYCETALRIYSKPPPGASPEDIANGLVDVSAVYESMKEHEQALKLLHRALKMYDDAPGQQSPVAGIEAQMGVLHYMVGNFSESYSSLKSAVTKLRACGEKKSAFFGVALNQMGLACVQRYAIDEAAGLFEEARGVLEQERGPCHPDTLAVYSNLSGTYDAMGRIDDAIEILEKIVAIREDKLGTANPDVDDEKRRLTNLLREAGKIRSKKPRSLQNLLITNHNAVVSRDPIAA